MVHRVVWVDIPVVDLNRAVAFYSAVFAQEVVRDIGPGYAFALLPHAGGEVGARLCLAGQDDPPSRSGPLVYLNVDGRLEQAVQAAAAHGGQVLQAARSIAPHGWRAIVLDSEGNRIALHALSG